MTEGVKLLENFVQSCIFIHDDLLDELRTGKGEHIWDQYSTHPFFIGAEVCVIDTLKGFGDLYLNYLNDMGCLPKTLIIPKYQHPSLLENILHDQAALNKLIKVVRKKHLHVSSFYSDKGKKYETLLAYLSDGTYIPYLFPSKHSFEFANDKVVARELFTAAGIPVPDGTICSSLSELYDFYKYCKNLDNPMLIKKFHWQTQFVCNEKDIESIADDLQFPVIAERVYKVQSSPVSHNIAWKGEIGHLFLINQIIEDWKHFGNSLPTSISNALLSRISRYALDFMSVLPEYIGVLGVDYIITPQEEIMAIDLNPRFNASTYPFYFLQRMGLNLDSVWARYRSVSATVPNLSIIFQDEDFTPFNKKEEKGVVLIGPTFNFEKELVVRFFYLAVAKSRADLESLELSLLRAIAKNRVP